MAFSLLREKNSTDKIRKSFKLSHLNMNVINLNKFQIHNY